MTDRQWIVPEPLLWFRRRFDGHGRPPQDTRAVLNGVIWVLGIGAQWRELPVIYVYVLYQTRHRRFQQWVRDCRCWRLEQPFAWLHWFLRLVIRQEY